MWIKDVYGEVKLKNNILTFWTHPWVEALYEMGGVSSDKVNLLFCGKEKQLADKKGVKTNWIWTLDSENRHAGDKFKAWMSGKAGWQHE